MDGSIVIFAILALIAVTLYRGVKQVPQGSKWVIQRLGKYHQTLSPGLQFIIPYIDNVAYKVTTKDIVLDIPSQEVITLDNVVIIANAVAYINILSPEKAVYGVEDYEIAIRTLVQTSLRSIVGEMSLDDALSSRNRPPPSVSAELPLPGPMAKSPLQSWRRMVVSKPRGGMRKPRSCLPKRHGKPSKK